MIKNRHIRIVPLAGAAVAALALTACCSRRATDAADTLPAPVPAEAPPQQPLDGRPTLNGEPLTVPSASAERPTPHLN